MFKNTCRLFPNLNSDKSETFQRVYFQLVDLVFELFAPTGDPLSMIFVFNEKKTFVRILRIEIKLEEVVPVPDTSDRLMLESNVKETAF